MIVVIVVVVVVVVVVVLIVCMLCCMKGYICKRLPVAEPISTGSIPVVEGVANTSVQARRIESPEVEDGFFPIGFSARSDKN